MFISHTTICPKCGKPLAGFSIKKAIAFLFEPTIECNAHFKEKCDECGTSIDKEVFLEEIKKRIGLALAIVSKGERQ